MSETQGITLDAARAAIAADKKTRAEAFAAELDVLMAKHKCSIRAAINIEPGPRHELHASSTITIVAE